MKLTYEITTSTLIVSQGFASPVQEITAKRGDGEYIALELLQNGLPWEAPGGCEFVFAAKKTGDYAGAALASADTWVYDASTGLYEAAINYEVEALDSLLLIATATENRSVKLMAEFAWTRPGLGGWRRSQEVRLKLENNVWRGTEDGPALPSASLLRPSIRHIASDVVNNNAVANTMADVTGLSFPVTAGKHYGFRFVLPYTAAATTTGARFSINGPAQDLLHYRSTWTLTATTESAQYASAYDQPAAAGATSLATGNVAIIEGVIHPTADGNVIARCASEVSASAITVKAGANVMFWEM